MARIGHIGRVWRGAVAIAAAGCLLAACVSVPQYDATTDAQISAVQQEVDAELVTLISLARSKDPGAKAEAGYPKAVAFYNKADTDLTSLELRMEAVVDPSTAKLPQFFSVLHDELNDIRDKHEKEGTLGEGFLKYTRAQMNAQFAVLLTYELSLKGVASPKSSTTSSTGASQASGAAAKTPKPAASK